MRPCSQRDLGSQMIGLGSEQLGSAERAQIGVLQGS